MNASLCRGAPSGASALGAGSPGASEGSARHATETHRWRATSTGTSLSDQTLHKFRSPARGVAAKPSPTARAPAATPWRPPTRRTRSPYDLWADALDRRRRPRQATTMQTTTTTTTTAAVTTPGAASAMSETTTPHGQSSLATGPGPSKSPRTDHAREQATTTTAAAATTTTATEATAATTTTAPKTTMPHIPRPHRRKEAGRATPAPRTTTAAEMRLLARRRFTGQDRAGGATTVRKRFRSWMLTPLPHPTKTQTRALPTASPQASGLSGARAESATVPTNGASTTSAAKSILKTQPPLRVKRRSAGVTGAASSTALPNPTTPSACPRLW